MFKKQQRIYYTKHRVTAIAAVIAVLFSFSCRDKNESLVALSYDPELVPSLVTDTATQLVSDSGITRYKMVYDVWMVFDKASDPYWYFPEGLYLERFTPDFEIEATVVADTAWYYTDKELWKLKNNVHVENMEGEQFDSDELYWDQKNGRVYSEAYIEIQQQDSRLKGYGFESNQEMTDYRIFEPRDGRIPLVDQPASRATDSLATASPDSLGESLPEPRAVLPERSMTRPGSSTVSPESPATRSRFGMGSDSIRSRRLKRVEER